MRCALDQGQLLAALRKQEVPLDAAAGRAALPRLLRRLQQLPALAPGSGTRALWLHAEQLAKERAAQADFNPEGCAPGGTRYL